MTDLLSDLSYVVTPADLHIQVLFAVDEATVAVNKDIGTDPLEIADIMTKRLFESGTSFSRRECMPEWPSVIPLFSCDRLDYHSGAFKGYEERLPFLPPEFLNHFARNRNPVLPSKTLQSHNFQGLGQVGRL